MKVTFALLSTILFNVLSFNPSYAQSRPVCFSATSDSDGDGYGWENEQTCIVAAEQSQCEDRGGFPWGWNPSSETSCRLDEQVTTNANPNTIEDLVVGTWVCNSMYLASPPFSSNPVAPPFEDEVITAMWSYYFRLISGQDAAQTLSQKLITLRTDGTASVSNAFVPDEQRFSSGSTPGQGTYVPAIERTWTVSDSRLLITDGGADPLLNSRQSGFSFEKINGVDFLHLYSSTTRRLTCIRQ